MATATLLLSLATFPSQSFDATITLARKLVDASKQKKLPKRLQSHAARLEAALDVAVASRLKQDVADAVSPEAREAVDRDADLLLGVMSDLLSAWQRLPADRFPQSAMAQTLDRALFPDGLRTVTQTTMDTQHTRMDLGVLRARKHTAALAATGVVPLLDAVEALLPDYKLAAEGAKPPTRAGSREAYDALAAATRAWALQVVAHVDEADANTAKRAARLLAPIAALKKKSPASRTKKAPAPQPVPVQP